MQIISVVHRLRLAWLCALLLLLAAVPHVLLAQEEPQQNASSQPQSAQQPTPPDTDQTKVNQPQPTVAAGTPATITLTTIRDQRGILSAAVPAAWNDVAEGAWLIAGAPAGWTISASPNQAEFVTNWGTPGVALFYSSSLPAAMEPEDLLGVFDFSASCQDGGRGSLPPAQRDVIYQIWQNCAEGSTAVAVLVLAPAGSRDYYAVVEVYMANLDDLRALGPILRSVRVGAAGTGGVPAAGAGEAPDTAAAPPAAETDIVTATLAAATPAPPPTPTPQPIQATVVTDRLNLRSGPSTDVPRLTVVTRGMQLTVTGQLDNCAWLRVTAPDGQQGWVSGDPNFTNLGVACEAVPLVENP